MSSGRAVTDRLPPSEMDRMSESSGPSSTQEPAAYASASDAVDFGLWSAPSGHGPLVAARCMHQILPSAKINLMRLAWPRQVEILRS